jgi:uncharacterized protein YneF (UPF0154 family)
MPSLHLVVASVVLLFVGTGFGLEAGAQSTTLRLINQVAEPGASGSRQGNTLSRGARVAVLTSRREDTPHAFSNIDFDREDLEWGIREGSAKTFRLTKGGRIPKKFEETSASGNFYYVLALTKEGKLLESYVYDESRRGYYPGFDRVVSGDMKMGPVPEEHREALRGALTSAMNPAETDNVGGSQAGEDTAETSSSKAGIPSSEKGEKRTEPTTAASDRSDGYLQTFWAALFSLYTAALLVGLLIGGIGAWRVYKKYDKKLSRRNRKINNLERKIYNQSGKKYSEKNIVHEKLLDKEKERARELEKELKRKEKEISRLRGESGQSDSTSSKRTSDREPWKEIASADHPQRSTAGASSSRSSQQDPTDRTADLIGRAFVNWCHDAGAAMVDRHSMFANKLQDSLPGAELQRIFREKNAAGIVFADDVQDAVEYWHVRVDGRDFLLPQPHRSGFREVEECFLANCTSPNQIQEVEPAELQSSGGEYKLESEGMLA